MAQATSFASYRTSGRFGALTFALFAGAIVAVPITAALVRAWPYLQGRVPAPPAGSRAHQPGETPQRPRQ